MITVNHHAPGVGQKIDTAIYLIASSCNTIIDTQALDYQYFYLNMLVRT